MRDGNSDTGVNKLGLQLQEATSRLTGSGILAGITSSEMILSVWNDFFILLAFRTRCI